MRIVATLMIRDEVDIVAAMLEHHISQGVDLIIATDNGSVDGTTAVLEAYAELGLVELHHDPVHRKQQHALVTGMAQRAFTEHGADWVLNIDADEFFLARDRSLTVRDALEKIPLDLGAFTAEVTNLVGAPAQRGSGIDRLIWRDQRPEEALRAVGVFAHPTPNAVHRGDAEVVVAQGNHFVSIASNGQPDPAFELEVLHLPWRSWEQTELKVVNSGRAYESSPDLRPSRNHHGMADYRRYKGGRLRYHYLLRLPTDEQIELGARSGDFVAETGLRDSLHQLVETARRPDLLRASLDSSHDDIVPDDEHVLATEIASMFIALEAERTEEELATLEANAEISSLRKQLANAPKYGRGRRLTRRIRNKAGRMARSARRRVTGD